MDQNEGTIQKLAWQIAQLSYEKAALETRVEAAEEQVRQLKAQHTDGVVSADGQAERSG